MELCTTARHNGEIQDRLRALEYEIHALKLGSGSLARRFGLNENLECDAKSFLSVSESLEDGEVLEYPFVDYWPAARKQGEIQRRTKALENGIRVMKWNFGLRDTTNGPCSPVLVNKVNPAPAEDTYRLAPELESLLDDLQKSRLHSEAAKEERNHDGLQFQTARKSRDSWTYPDINPKSRAGRVKTNPHPNLSIKHSILTNFILDADRSVRNVACSLYLRRECKPPYIYNFNELEANMFYDWRWGRYHIFEDRAALWPSVVYERLKPDFREIEKSGFRVLAWRLCNVDGVVPLWLDRHGFWISGVPVHRRR
ncbi:hypothetical protein FPRO03_07114 [Fusarium proliferatum]|nr:hypothetical protein FPRO03_07114 [Fusarium proliferatum]